MTTYPLQTQPRRLGDLSIWETNPMYTRHSATVKNNAGSTTDIIDPLGYPLISDGSGGYQLAIAGQEGSVIGLLLWEAEINLAAGVYTPYPVTILVRGPAAIDYSFGIPATDYAASAFNITTIVTTLKALSPPIISFAEPALQTTQTS